MIWSGCAQPAERDATHAVSVADSIQNHSTSTFGALLSTHFQTLDDLERIVDIRYAHDPMDTTKAWRSYSVTLTCKVDGREVKSMLRNGISEDDFLVARRGNWMDKFFLGCRCPFAVMHRKALMCIENLGRRRPWDFGKGDVAFYDLAEIMVSHICKEDTARIPPLDLTEKGYLNTFNHITAQAFMTALFSRETADFVADVHERHTLPQLITGRFTPTQLEDPAEGPVDNYVDMLNNEWGQELGLTLAAKYSITDQTYWTPELLTACLNDIQAYYSYALGVGFTPFRPSDEIVIRFTAKINKLLFNDI